METRCRRVLFRSDWTDPPTIELVLKYLLTVRATPASRGTSGGLLCRIHGLSQH